MKIEEYEFFRSYLELNEITYGESLKKDEKRWQEYKQTAMLWLNNRGRFFIAKEILENYNSKRTLEEILAENKERYIAGHFIELPNETREQVYYDIWGNHHIEHSDSFFPFFFACKLSQVDLLDLDSFLKYHFEENYNKNKQEYFRFLEVVIRRYKHLLNEDTKQTINEWVNLKRSEPELSGTPNTEAEKKVKVPVKRQAGDKLTKLSAVQTALLIQYMQESNLILKSDYVDFTAAGRAFALLTGYSPDSIRQYLGTKGDLQGAKFEDYKELHEAILKLSKLIEEKIKKK